MKKCKECFDTKDGKKGRIVYEVWGNTYVCMILVLANKYLTSENAFPNYK